MNVLQPMTGSLEVVVLMGVRSRLTDMTVLGALLVGTPAKLCCKCGKIFIAFCAAIHNAAGPKLLAACKALPIVQKPAIRCPTGDAKITEYASE